MWLNLSLTINYHHPLPVSVKNDWKFHWGNYLKGICKSKECCGGFSVSFLCGEKMVCISTVPPPSREERWIRQSFIELTVIYKKEDCISLTIWILGLLSYKSNDIEHQRILRKNWHESPGFQGICEEENMVHVSSGNSEDRMPALEALSDKVKGVASKGSRQLCTFIFLDSKWA